MATKKIGIYGELTSTANNKVEDLFVIVEEQAIHFLIKNIHTDTFVAFESFEMSDPSEGYHSLIAFLQNHSNLILSYYRWVKFVNNLSPIVLTKNKTSEDPLVQNAEIDLLFGNSLEQEFVSNALNDNTDIMYTVPHTVQTLLSRMFPTGKWVHYFQYCIEKHIQAGICVHVFGAKTLFMLRDENNILLAKYIPTTESADILYSLLAIAEQLSIPLEKLSVYCAGLSENAKTYLQPLAHQVASLYFEDYSDAGLGAIMSKESNNHIYQSYLIF